MRFQGRRVTGPHRYAITTVVTRYDNSRCRIISIRELYEETTRRLHTRLSVWSIDVARADRVHANAAIAEFVGPGASEGADGCLGGAVNAHG
jgi:hypothetical protein